MVEKYYWETIMNVGEKNWPYMTEASRWSNENFVIGKICTRFEKKFDLFRHVVCIKLYGDT